MNLQINTLNYDVSHILYKKDESVVSKKEKRYDLYGLQHGLCTMKEYFEYHTKGEVTIFYPKALFYKRGFYIIRTKLADYDGNYYIEFKMYSDTGDLISKDREYYNLKKTSESYWLDQCNKEYFRYYLCYLGDDDMITLRKNIGKYKKG